MWYVNTIWDRGVAHTLLSHFDPDLCDRFSKNREKDMTIVVK